MTTAIALETSKGDFAQGIALGLVLLLMAFVINLALAFLRRRGGGMSAICAKPATCAAL